jgi:glycerophosphoryl diester phosphodiesterase
LTLVIAHRGASAYEPENSLAAFRAARELGADGVELDVQTTADGAFVIHHDPHAGAVLIPEAARDRVRAHRLPNGEPLPFLAEALDVLGRDLTVFVEVKTLPPSLDEAFLAALAAGPAPERYHVHAFDHRIVRRLKQRRPRLPCGVLSSSYPLEPLRQLEDAGAEALWQGEDLVDAPLVRQAHERGYRVYAWNVDHPPRMRALEALGVDGICTNVPDVAREVLRR